jgi:multidrug efflux pump subunit AcrB
VIRHESVSPYLDVAITVADGYEQAEVAESLQSALSSAEFTLGFHAQLLGDYSEEREARTTVRSLAAVAILAMFLLFQAALNSWRLASLGMVAIGFVIATGILTVAIFGGQMTVGSLIGLLGGIGLVARGMILLVRHYQYLAGHGTAPGAGLIEQVAMDGMPSTAFTLLSVILLFFPVAVRMGAPGMEVAGPLALSVIGSAVGAGAFILLALPALYRWWGAFAPEPDSPDDLFVVDMSQAERVLG